MSDSVSCSCLCISHYIGYAGQHLNAQVNVVICWHLTQPEAAHVERRLLC